MSSRMQVYWRRTPLPTSLAGRGEPPVGWTQRPAVMAVGLVEAPAGALVEHTQYPLEVAAGRAGMRLVIGEGAPMDETAFRGGENADHYSFTDLLQTRIWHVPRSARRTAGEVLVRATQVPAREGHQWYSLCGILSGQAAPNAQLDCLWEGDVRWGTGGIKAGVQLAPQRAVGLFHGKTATDILYQRMWGPGGWYALQSDLPLHVIEVIDRYYNVKFGPDPLTPEQERTIAKLEQQYEGILRPGARDPEFHAYLRRLLAVTGPRDHAAPIGPRP